MTGIKPSQYGRQGSISRPPPPRVLNEVKVMDCKNHRARSKQRPFIVRREKNRGPIPREPVRQAHLIPPLSPARIDRLESDLRQRDGKPGVKIAIDDAFYPTLRRRTQHLDQVPTDSGAHAIRQLAPIYAHSYHAV